jgi:hypothetical protein
MVDAGATTSLLVVSLVGSCVFVKSTSWPLCKSLRQRRRYHIPPLLNPYLGKMLGMVGELSMLTPRKSSGQTGENERDPMGLLEVLLEAQAEARRQLA